MKLKTAKSKAQSGVMVWNLSKRKYFSFILLLIGEQSTMKSACIFKKLYLSHDSACFNTTICVYYAIYMPLLSQTFFVCLFFFVLYFLVGGVQNQWQWIWCSTSATMTVPVIWIWKISLSPVEANHRNILCHNIQTFICETHLSTQKEQNKLGLYLILAEILESGNFCKNL